MKEYLATSKKLKLRVSSSTGLDISVKLRQLLDDCAKELEKLYFPLKSTGSLYPKKCKKVDQINFKGLGIKKAQIDVTICGSQKIKTINKAYRKKNKATDVLSFPLYESLRKANSDELFFEESLLGDIIISKDVAKKQAKEFGISFEGELIHLIVHGALHLVGYDHEISLYEENLMFTLEEKIVDRIFK